MSETPVLVETCGRVGMVTLNRPRQLNALDDALMDALGAALLAFDADDGIGAIVIAGGPKAFAAGADITAMVDWGYIDVFRSDYITRNRETIGRVRKPVIAAVAAVKESVNRACETSLTEGMSFERRQPHARFASDDAHEGMRAFLERRAPQFKHR